MEDLKHQLEAILFSAGRKVTIEELSKMCKTDDQSVKDALAQLRADYEQKNTALMVVEEGDSWKLSTREKHLELVRNIVTETELTKAVMETLAVIAFKYPIMQSELIKIRTNKAYEHIKELEESGYITRQKHGRSKLIKLTQKFFDYFDLPEEKLKDKFSDFESIAAAIEEKEKESDAITAEQKKIAEEEKSKEENISKNIEEMDEEKLGDLEVYEETQDKPVEVQIVDENQKVGGLEIVDALPPQEEKEETVTEALEEQLHTENKEEEHETKTSDGIEITDEQEKEVKRHVDKMLHGEETHQQESSEDGIAAEVETADSTDETVGDSVEEDTESEQETSEEENLESNSGPEEESEEKVAETLEEDKLKDEVQDKIDAEIKKMTTADSEDSSDEQKEESLEPDSEEGVDLLEASNQESEEEDKE